MGEERGQEEGGGGAGGRERAWGHVRNRNPDGNHSPRHAHAHALSLSLSLSLLPSLSPSLSPSLHPMPPAAAPVSLKSGSASRERFQSNGCPPPGRRIPPHLSASRRPGEVSGRCEEDEGWRGRCGEEEGWNGKCGEEDGWSGKCDDEDEKDASLLASASSCSSCIPAPPPSPLCAVRGCCSTCLRNPSTDPDMLSVMLNEIAPDGVFTPASPPAPPPPAPSAATVASRYSEVSRVFFFTPPPGPSGATMGSGPMPEPPPGCWRQAMDAAGASIQLGCVAPCDVVAAGDWSHAGHSDWECQRPSQIASRRSLSMRARLPGAQTR
jgi:hypothetical protein